VQEKRLLGSDSIREMSRTTTEASAPGVQGFEPLSVYDAPGVIVSQILNDSATFQSIRDTFLNPSNLSPRQRETLRASIFGERPEGVMKMVQGVLTNPWVWLFFATSAVGSKALAAHGPGALFKQGKAWEAWIGKDVPLLAETLPSIEAFGPVAGAHLTEINGQMQRLAKVVGAEAEVATNKFLSSWAKKGLKFDEMEPLNPGRYAKGTKEWEVVTSYNQFAGHANMLGWAEAPNMDNVVEFKSGVRMTQNGVSRFMGEGEIQQRLIREGEGGSQAIRQADLGAVVGLQRKEYEKWLREWKKLPKVFRKEYTKEGASWKDWAREQKDFIQYEGMADVSNYEQAALSVNGVPRTVLDRAGMVKLYEMAGGREAWDLLVAKREATKRNFVVIVGDESAYKATGEFVADPEKVRNLAGRLRNQLESLKTPDSPMIPAGSRVQGLEVMYSLLGHDQVNMAMGLDDGGKTLVDLLTKAVAGGVNQERWRMGAFQSRNVMDAIPVKASDGRWMLPSVQVDDLHRKNLHATPNSMIQASPKHLASVVDAEPTIHPDDLLELDALGVLPEESKDLIEVFRDRAQKQWQKDGRMTMGLRVGRAEESYQRTIKNGIESAIMDTMSVLPKGESVGFPGAIALDEEWRLKWHADPERVQEIEGNRTKLGLRDDVRVVDSIVGRGDITMGDLLERAGKRLGSPKAQEMFRAVFIPSALHTAGVNYLNLYTAHQRTRATAEWFVKSWIGKAARKFGGEGGRRFYETMERAANPLERLEIGSFDKGLARWLYTSHLGLNMGSVLLNLTQPFLMAATVAHPDQVAKAFGTTLKEFWTYGTERAKLGLREISGAEHQQLMKKSFHLENFGPHGESLLGLADKGLDLVEHGLGAGQHAMDWKKRSKLDRALTFMMKPFEKSEQFNRVFTGNIVEEMYRGAKIDVVGNLENGVRFGNDTKRFVMAMQFAGSPENMPMIFSHASGPFSMLANPLARMFLTFPMRMATTALYTMPRLGGSDDAVKQGVNLFLRGMGMSAFLYEVGKGLLGADLSRGLYFSGVTDIVGGERLMEGKGSPLPIPPVVQIPWDLMSGTLREDTKMIASALSRTVPGGVAMMKALNALPQLPVIGPQSMGLQSTSVGWGQVTPDGKVPIFRSDGSLIEWKPRSEVVARAMGVDMGAWQQQGALDGYLVKQREKFVAARHDFLRALGSNDVGRAMRIKKEFERTHGIPLTVGGSQVKAYLQGQSTTRTQRTLNTFPREIRDTYTSMANATPGVTQERNPITNEQIAALQRRVEELASVGPASRSTHPTPFAPFTP